MEAVILIFVPYLKCWPLKFQKKFFPNLAIFWVKKRQNLEKNQKSGLCKISWFLYVARPKINKFCWLLKPELNLKGLFCSKMYLEADFWVRRSRKWVDKVQTIISFRFFYNFLILPFKVKKKWSWKQLQFPIFWRLSITFMYVEWKLLRVWVYCRRSGASRIMAGQGIWMLRQCILGHLRPLKGGKIGLFKDTLNFECRRCIPLPL